MKTLTLDNLEATLRHFLFSTMAPKRVREALDEIVKRNKKEKGRHQRAVKVLQEIVNTSVERSVRLIAARAISSYGGRGARQKLCRECRFTDKEIRKSIRHA